MGTSYARYGFKFDACVVKVAKNDWRWLSREVSLLLLEKKKKRSLTGTLALLIAIFSGFLKWNIFKDIEILYEKFFYDF